MTTDVETDQILSEALLKIRSLKAEVQRLSSGSSSTRGVAMIGCAMRLPGGVHDLESLAELLYDGRATAGPIPADRWDPAQHFSPDRKKPGRTYARSASLIGNIDGFDAAFFGISPPKAAEMDPQHRLLLEVVWQALEDAGIAPGSLKGSRTGVYVGMSSDDYSHGNINSGDTSRITAFSTLGNLRSMAAGRIAYLLDLAGPCLQLDTACSSSLVGVHMARAALLSGEIDLAIVASAHLVISPHGHIAGCKLRALSEDGRCKPFDAAADGYGRGEGVAALVLKRADDALRDEDTVLGTVLGSAVNHDGRSNGMTAPNGSRQEAVLRDALQAARVDPASVRYVEAHGTGTPLGDPIEAIALGKVYAPPGVRGQPLLIGSIKSSIGHLEAAAGLAGLLKLLVIGRHRRIPPNPHFEVPSPYIPWQDLALEVNRHAVPLEATGPALRMAVSSFGMSGTNCHVVVEQVPPRPVPLSMQDGPHLLCLSARTPAALNALLERFHRQMTRGDCDLAALCRSANEGRDHFEHRVALLAPDLPAMVEQVGRALRGEEPVSRATAQVRIAFAFGFTGRLHDAVFTHLMDEHAVFASAWQEACRHLAPADSIRPTAEFRRQLGAGGAVFAEQWAQARLWQAWGVQAEALVAGGIGKLAAGVLAGVIDLQGAAALLHRSEGLRAPSPPMGPALVPLLDARTGQPWDMSSPGAGFQDLQPGPAAAPPLDGYHHVLSLADLGGTGHPDRPRPTASEALATARTLLMSELKRLYLLGLPLQWRHVRGRASGARVRLPGYPFQPVRHWQAPLAGPSSNPNPNLPP